MMQLGIKSANRIQITNNINHAQKLESNWSHILFPARRFINCSIHQPIFSIYVIEGTHHNMNHI